MLNSNGCICSEEQKGFVPCLLSLFKGFLTRGWPVTMTCYFASNRFTGCERSAATDLTKVSCTPESIKSISEYLKSLSDEISLYGCSAVELIFLRGNGEKISDLDHPEKEFICRPHFDFLLASWPNKEQVKISMKNGQKITKCTLTHESPRAVFKEAGMRKEEVIEWLANTGELIHVGSPICKTHRVNLNSGEVKTTVESSGKNVPPIRHQRHFTQDTDFNLDSLDLGPDGIDDYESASDVDEMTVQICDREKISTHFSAIADLLGSSHYSPKRDWNILAEDTKRRKISLVFTMVQMLCAFVAPGSASELEHAVAEKLSPKNVTGSDKCASQVLSAIGERILAAPNRRTRVETLSMIVDLPYFSASKILLSIPTVTRYLIHKARMFNRGGVNFDEKYNKVRKNDEALDFFVSFVVRANVVLSLSWINNFAKRTDDTKVEMGASVRLHSYVAIDRMYRAELHKYQKDKSLHLSYGTIYKMLSSIFPRMNRRMVCVDEFFVDAGEQSADVSCIFRDVHQKLKRRGITKVTLRSDNAGCFKSSELLGDLFQIANETPVIDRYIYSESQAGKGPCDRAASHMKRKINECTKSRKNARDAKEIFQALTTNEVVRGTSTYRCVMGPETKKKKSVIPDISMIYDVEFQADAIVSRKHCGIGKGQSTPRSKLAPLNSSFAIIEEGGCIGDNNFWVRLNGSTNETNGELDEINDQPLSLRKDFVCSTPGCVASFLKMKNLERHEIIGKHKYKSKKQSLLDRTIDLFNEKIETVEVAQEGRAKDSFVNTTTDNEFKQEMGWALKKTSSNGISDKAHNAAAAYFMEQRSMNPPRRAEPRPFSLQMESMREPDGNYTFEVDELLSEKQLTGLFSRLEKKRMTGVSVAVRRTRGKGRQQSKSSRKRTHPASSEEEIVEKPVESDDDLTDDDFEREVDEEFIVREGIDEEHNEIFL